ncbi:MAG: GIY-YIG nuclease family protein [bacterium]|nr:GIY-YIG nuclease family protein [bacterium]
MNKKFIYFIYILTNKNNSTFYIGVTNNIVKRLFEHRTELIEGFTKRYKLKKLVYLEEFTDIKEAIAREKQLKNWHREWKLNLIKKVNPEFNDLSVF